MITVIITAHNEGHLLSSSICSALENKDFLQTTLGVQAEIKILLDRADVETKRIAASFSCVKTEELDFGDLSLSRNFGASQSTSQFISFLDGDDVWCKSWLVEAYLKYLSLGLNRSLILHPEYSLYFGDLKFSSLKAMKHPATSDLGFDSTGLVFRNFWTALSFSKREIYLSHAFKPMDKNLLLGFEDWTFNLETISSGIEHVAVPGTVHFLRSKRDGSLLKNSVKARMLPHPV